MRSNIEYEKMFVDTDATEMIIDKQATRDYRLSLKVAHLAAGNKFQFDVRSLVSLFQLSNNK